MTDDSQRLTRLTRLTRRRALAGAGAVSLASVLPTPAEASPTPHAGRRRGGSIAWLGNSGWRITAAGQTVLVDPYLTRFPVGLAAGSFDPATALRVAEDEVLRAAGQPSTVLVTHAHWDHFNDVPFLATRFGARIIATTTTCQLASSFGVPAGQLAPVKGGEELDFGDLVVRAVPSLHSRTAAYAITFPGTRTTPPPRPRTIADLPEGDTLAFAVWRPSGRRAFFMGASDFDDQVLHGLEPDVAAIAVPATNAVHDYVPRLLDALHRPRIVIPVHWDDFESPLRNPPRATATSRRQLEDFVRAVRHVSRATTILTPDYLEELELL